MCVIPMIRDTRLHLTWKTTAKNHSSVYINLCTFR